MLYNNFVQHSLPESDLFLSTCNPFLYPHVYFSVFALYFPPFDLISFVSLMDFPLWLSPQTEQHTLFFLHQMKRKKNKRKWKKMKKKLWHKGGCWLVTRQPASCLQVITGCRVQRAMSRSLTVAARLGQYQHMRWLTERGGKKQTAHFFS